MPPRYPGMAWRERAVLAWTELFAVFAVCHVVGDFLFQTDWQALYKHGGIQKGGEHLRALTAHVAVYTLSFLPALIWIADEAGIGLALGTAAAVFIPHFVQDDGWVVARWMTVVKHT